MKDTIVILANSDSVINDNYKHYYLSNNILFYNTTEINFSTLENYKKYIVQNSYTKDNGELLTKYGYTVIRITYESDSIKKITLKNKLTYKTKMLL